MLPFRRFAGTSASRVGRIPRQNNATVGGIAAVLAGLSSGMGGSFWPGIHAPAPAIAAWRLLFGSLIYIGIQILRRRSPWISRQQLPVVLFGSAVFGLGLVTLAAATQRTLMITVFVIGAAAPAITVVAEHFLFHRQLSVRAWVCIVATCLAASIAVIGFHSSQRELSGNVFAVVSEFAFITYTLITSRAVHIMPIDRYLGAISVIGFICLSPWLFLAGAGAFSVRELGLILGIAIFGGVGNWGLFLFAQRHIHTGPAAAFGLVSVPTGTFFAWWFYSQTPRIAQIVSGFLVILAVGALLYVQTQEEKRMGVQDEILATPEPIVS